MNGQLTIATGKTLDWLAQTIDSGNPMNLGLLKACRDVLTELSQWVGEVETENNRLIDAIDVVKSELNQEVSHTSQLRTYAESERLKNEQLVQRFGALEARFGELLVEAKRLQAVNESFRGYLGDVSEATISNTQQLTERISTLEAENKALIERLKSTGLVLDPRMPKVGRLQLELEKAIDKYTIDSMDVIGEVSMNHAEVLGTLDMVKLNYFLESTSSKAEDEVDDVDE